MCQRLVQLADLPLQGGDLTGFVVPAAVQLLFQPLIRLGVGGLLLTGGDKSGDAPLQFRILVYDQRALADEGTAGKHLRGNAQQLLAGVPCRNAGYRRCRTGKSTGEVAHRRRSSPRVTLQRVGFPLCLYFHLPAHESAAPGCVTVLVRQGTPVPCADAIQHAADESAPGGLAGFIGGIYDIQAGLQRQLRLLQRAERGIHCSDLHKKDLRGIYIQNILYHNADKMSSGRE